jgi:hypothetical protein
MALRSRERAHENGRADEETTIGEADASARAAGEAKQKCGGYQ